MLMALRLTCIFITAQSATCVAAKKTRVPHGRAAVVRRRRSLTNGDSRDKAACIHGWLAYAFVRLRRPKAQLRETLLPRPPDDALSVLPILVLACVLRGKRRARAAFGGHGWYQPYSGTEPTQKIPPDEQKAPAQKGCYGLRWIKITGTIRITLDLCMLTVCISCRLFSSGGSQLTNLCQI